MTMQRLILPRATLKMESVRLMSPWMLLGDMS